MLQSIRIKNFQSHKDSFLEFAPGVNVIVGLSDHGKSGIIRAINWIITNRPTGTAFMTDKKGTTKVVLSLDDQAVSRIKSSKSNEYQTSFIKEPLKAIGKDVPEEIRKFLNIEPLNIHFQFMPHFLLSSSPPDVQRYLNQIVDLEVIDKAQSKISSMINKASSIVIGYETRLHEAKEELKQYDYLEQFEEGITNLEKKEAKLTALEDNYDKLRSLIKEIKESGEKINKLTELLGAELTVDGLIRKSKEIKNLQNKKSFLQEETQIIKTYQTEYNKLKEFLVVEQEVKDLLDIDERVRQLEVEEIELGEKIDKIRIYQDKFEETNQRLKELEEEFHTNFPEVCPLCGSGSKKRG